MVLKIQSKTGRMYEGEGFCVDPLTKSIVLKTTDGEYIFINPFHISSITGGPIVIPVPEAGEIRYR